MLFNNEKALLQSNLQNEPRELLETPESHNTKAGFVKTNVMVRKVYGLDNQQPCKLQEFCGSTTRAEMLVGSKRIRSAGMPFKGIRYSLAYNENCRGEVRSDFTVTKATPTDLYCNPKVKADLCKTFFPKERYDLFEKTSTGLVGLDIKGFTSPAGDVRFNPDVFIDDGGTVTAARGDAAKRPATPTVAVAPTTPTDALSKFEIDDAGDYFYKVQAVNRYGRSAAVDLVAGPTAVAVDTGEKTTFGMAPPGSTPSVEWYEVFRTKKDGAVGTTRLVLKVKNTAGTGTMTINDFNDSLPGCTSAFLFQQNMENMSFKQLAPLVKIPLATVDSSIRKNVAACVA